MPNYKTNNCLRRLIIRFHSELALDFMIFISSILYGYTILILHFSQLGLFWPKIEISSRVINVQIL